MKITTVHSGRTLAHRLSLILMLLIASQLGFAQVSLGSLTNFSLFSGIGAIANTGPLTHIQGSVGTNIGAISGYQVSTPSQKGNVDGEIHGTDGTSNTGATDVQAAYLALQALPATVVVEDSNLGGHTIPAGTYSLGGATSLNGTLTLDAFGDEGAIFVFQIDGALSVGAASQVVLASGGSANNIFWQVNGATTIAAQSTFMGTIIANGAIDLGDGVTLNGRALATVGAISTYNNQITTTTSFVPAPAFLPPPPEPVLLTAVAAIRSTYLTWTPASASDWKSFDVEISADGITFNSIKNVRGHSFDPNSNTYHQLVFLPTKSGSTYFRLREVSKDDLTIYSPLLIVNPISGSAMTAYPNPFKEKLSVAYTQFFNLPVHLQISDLNGKVFWSYEGMSSSPYDVNAPNTVLNLDNIASGLPPGQYILQFKQDLGNPEYLIETLRLQRDN